MLGFFIVAAICVFNSIFMPINFFGELKKLGQVKSDKGFLAETNHFNDCKKVMERLEFISFAILVVCFGTILLTEEDFSILGWLITVLVAVWGVLTIWTTTFIKRLLKEKNIVVPERRTIRFSFGIFEEGVIILGFLFPYFSLIYHILYLVG